jgi:hypothetical protein
VVRVKSVPVVMVGAAARPARAEVHPAQAEIHLVEVSLAVVSLPEDSRMEVTLAVGLMDRAAAAAAVVLLDKIAVYYLDQAMLLPE